MDRTRLFIKAGYVADPLIIGRQILTAMDMVEVSITLSAVPTSAGLITIARRDVPNPEYNTIIRQLDPVALGLTSLLCTGEPVMAYFQESEFVDVTYDNPDGMTVGVRVTMRGAK